MSSDLVTYLKADTTDSVGFNHNSYRAVLAGMNDPRADYMQAQDYITQGYSDSAFTVFDSMPVKYNIDTLTDSTYITYSAFMQFQSSLVTDSIPFSHLDSVHLIALNNIAKGYGPAARGAQAILHFFYHYPYETHLEIPYAAGGATRSLNFSPPANALIDSTTNGYLKAYPNPTNGNEIFQFQLPCTNAEGWLVIANISGQTISTTEVNSTITQITVDTKSWQNGLYLYRLTCNNIIVGSGKFEVMK